jgi:HlyD family secretion protein
MPFEEGDIIHRGQIVARIDPTPFQQAFHQSQAQLGVQTANLKKLLVGTRPEQVAQLQANVVQQQVLLNNASELLAKDQAVVMKGAVSWQDYQNALDQRNAAAARLEAAKQALLEGIHGPIKEEIQAARASEKAANAAKAQSATQLSYVQIMAPSDGIVQTRVREPGSIVAPGDPVYTIALLTPKWVQTYLEEPDLGRVKPGMRAQVFTDTAPKQAIIAQIGYISPIAEFTPKNVETVNQRTALVYPMRVVVRDPQNILRQGMPVTVRIQTGISRNTERHSHD